MNKCKLLNWRINDEVVAEGRWQTQEPQTLVSGVPLGPHAVKVFVDVVYEPGTFLWRPTTEMTYLEDALLSSIAWPTKRVVFEEITDARGQQSPLLNSAATDQATSAKSAAKTPKSAAAGSKSPIEKSGSKTLIEKSAKTGDKSPLQKTPVSGLKPHSESPIRRSQVICFVYVMKLLLVLLSPLE